MSGKAVDGAGEDSLLPGLAAGLRAAFEAERLLIPSGGRIVELKPSAATLAITLARDAAEPERAGLVAIAGQCAARLAVLASLPVAAQCRVVEHKIDFGGAIPAGDIIAEAAVVRPGGSITATRTRIVSAAGEGCTVAMMQATFLHTERLHTERKNSKG